MGTSSAGWWRDPTGRHEHRYWDGAGWSDNVSDRGVTSVDPIVRPPMPSTSRNVLVVGAVVAVVLVVAVAAVVVTGGGGRGGEGGGVFVEIPVGMAGEVAVGGGAVWVLDHTDRKILRIDPETGEVTDEVAVDHSRGLAAGDGAVWVGARPDGGPGSDVLLRLDPTTLATVAEVPLGAGPDVDAVAAGPGSVWVATQGAEVVQIDATTDEIVAESSIRGESFELAVGADAAWVIAVGGSMEAVLQRVDAASGEVTSVDLAAEGDVPAGENIVLHAVAAADGAAWVVRYHVSPPRELVGMDLCRIESEGLAVRCAELAAADTVSSIAAGDDAVWVSTNRDGADTVVGIDPETLEVTTEIDLPTVSVLDMEAGEGALWMANRAGDEWSVLQIPT